MDGWEGYDEATYGDRVAGFYDEAYDLPDTPATVERLTELAGAGPVLELGLGTGRIAIPLAELGLEVHGIDASAAMVDVMRSKPGGSRVTVTLGDFGELDVPGRPFSLIFIAFNTFFTLLNVEAQRRCFGQVVEHLAPDGRFVLQAFVPDERRWFDRDQRVDVARLTMDSVGLDASRHDPDAQRIDSVRLWFGPWGQRIWPTRIRYSYPAELDEMATAAGLRLDQRWSDWDKSPFVPDDSSKHVSVYVRE